MALPELALVLVTQGLLRAACAAEARDSKCWLAAVYPRGNLRRHMASRSDADRRHEKVHDFPMNFRGPSLWRERSAHFVIGGHRPA